MVIMYLAIVTTKQCITSTTITGFLAIVKVSFVFNVVCIVATYTLMLAIAVVNPITPIVSRWVCIFLITDGASCTVFTVCSATETIFYLNCRAIFTIALVLSVRIVYPLQPNVSFGRDYISHIHVFALGATEYGVAFVFTVGKEYLGCHKLARRFKLVLATLTITCMPRFVFSCPSCGLMVSCRFCHCGCCATSASCSPNAINIAISGSCFHILSPSVSMRCRLWHVVTVVSISVVVTHLRVAVATVVNGVATLKAHECDDNYKGKQNCHDPSVSAPPTFLFVFIFTHLSSKNSVPMPYFANKWQCARSVNRQFVSN